MPIERLSPGGSGSGSALAANYVPTGSVVTTTTAVTNTTTETALYTYTVPGLTFGAGSLARVKLAGRILSTVGTVNCRFRWYYGGVLIMDSGAGQVQVIAAAGNRRWSGALDLVFPSTTTLRCGYSMPVSSTNDTTQDVVSAAHSLVGAASGTTPTMSAVDTTVAADLKLTATWGSAVSTSTIESFFGYTEILGIR